jgi:hypothetical protein
MKTSAPDLALYQDPTKRPAHTRPASDVPVKDMIHGKT